MREDDHNIILRKHREVQRYSFQNASKQISTQTILFPMCKGFPQ
jgi:hypothetical protein